MSTVKVAEAQDPEMQTTGAFTYPRCQAQKLSQIYARLPEARQQAMVLHDPRYQSQNFPP